jgi:hypothetical protein
VNFWDCVKGLDRGRDGVVCANDVWHRKHWMVGMRGAKVHDFIALTWNTKHIFNINHVKLMIDTAFQLLRARWIPIPKVISTNRQLHISSSVCYSASVRKLTAAVVPHFDLEQHHEVNKLYTGKVK